MLMDAHRICFHRATTGTPFTLIFNLTLNELRFNSNLSVYWVFFFFFKHPLDKYKHSKEEEQILTVLSFPIYQVAFRKHQYYLCSLFISQALTRDLPARHWRVREKDKKEKVAKTQSSLWAISLSAKTKGAAKAYSPRVFRNYLLGWGVERMGTGVGGGMEGHTS